MSKTVTGSLETDINADTIFEFVGEPRNLPQWAPGFADAVEPIEGDRWNVRKGERVFSIEVVVNQSSRTVDFVREIAPGKKGGASLRVLQLPGSGSVIVMTLPVANGTTPDAVTGILNQELKDIVRLNSVGVQ